jgi:hypothetical protein
MIDFGAAGENAAFMEEYYRAVDDQRKRHWKNGSPSATLGQMQKENNELMKRFYAMAASYNQNKGQGQYQSAREDWKKYTGNNLGSVSAGVYGATVNIQTGPVTQMGGEQYVTKGDMERATRETANQVLNQLRNNPSTRREVGLAR